MKIRGELLFLLLNFSANHTIVYFEGVHEMEEFKGEIRVGDMIVINAKGIEKSDNVVYAWFDGEYWCIDTDNFSWKQEIDGGQIVAVYPLKRKDLVWRYYYLSTKTLWRTDQYLFVVFCVVKW